MTWLAGEERPDAICLSNGMLLGLAPRLREVLGVPIYCTLQGEAPFLDTLREPYLSDAWQAMRDRTGVIEGFIAVSEYYGDLMGKRLGIEPERLHVVGVSLDEKRDTLERMIAERGITWPQIWDRGGDTSLEEVFAISDVPAVFLLGPGGELLTGEITLREAEERLPALLGGGAASAG